MNECFLVVISCQMDDLPVCIRPSEASARDWAKRCDPDTEAARVGNQRGIDVTDLVCIRVAKFVNGVPVSDEIVRDLETEDDEIGGAS